MLKRDMASRSRSMFLLLALSLAAVSPAGAATWRQIGPRGAVIALAVTPGLPGQPPTVVSSLEGESLFRSSDGGSTWTSGELGPAPGGCSFLEEKEAAFLVAAPESPGTIYASGSRFSPFLWKSTDAGLHWQTTSLHPTTAVLGMATVPGDPGHLLALTQGFTFPIDPQPPCAGGGFTGLVESRDGGQDWSALVSADPPFAAVAADPASQQVYLAQPGAPNLLLVTRAGGLSWTMAVLPGLVAPGPVALRVDGSTSPSTVFLVLSGVPHGLYRFPGSSTVGLVQPVESAAGIPATAEISDLLVDPGVPGQMWAATSVGVYRSTDHGASWEREGDGPPFPALRLALDPRPLGPLYAGTEGDGVYVLDRGCRASATVSCLDGFRFDVGVSFQLAGGGTQPAHVRPLTRDTAAFWFFDPANLEVLVKVVDGRPVNGKLWIFSGGLSDVKYTVTATDYATGESRSYDKPAGQLSSFADTAAFPRTGTESPAAASLASGMALLSPAAPCTAGARSLCLSASRFRVEVSFSALGIPGTGTAIPLTDDTGAFWFLGPENLELAVKVLDGRLVNGHFWVFYGALSDLHYTLTVTDTLTGATKIYNNPAGRLASAADTAAF